MNPNAKLPDEITIKKKEEEKKEEPPVEKAEEKKKPEKKKTDIKKLTEIQGVGPSIVKKFEKAGITSLEEIYEMDVDDLASINGIGGKTAENIIKRIGKLLEKVA
jgi:predicted flap endonuclease-1-like 5' DNA nuclease